MNAKIKASALREMQGKRPDDMVWLRLRITTPLTGEDISLLTVWGGEPLYDNGLQLRKNRAIEPPALVHDIDRYIRRPRGLHKGVGRFLPASLVADHHKFQRGQVWLGGSGAAREFDEVLGRAGDKRRLHDREYPDCPSHGRPCVFSLRLAKLARQDQRNSHPW